jgi:hypothetical protein
MAVVVRAHSGPPFPIVSNQHTGSYIVSVWTDPDATDTGVAAGRFWVVLEPDRAGEIPADTRVTISIAPRDRAGSTKELAAQPTDAQATRHFAALVMDHEGPFAVKVTIGGSLGRAEVDCGVDATYDTRPGKAVLYLSLLPFVLIGTLWLKLLLRRRGLRQ